MGNISSAATCDGALCRLGRAEWPSAITITIITAAAATARQRCAPKAQSLTPGPLDRGVYVVLRPRYMTDSLQDCLDYAFPQR
jgi:hypothetical protein